MRLISQSFTEQWVLSAHAQDGQRNGSVQTAPCKQVDIARWLLEGQ